MGWSNPPVPWREIERRLSGRVPGAEDAPVSRRKRRTAEPQEIVRPESVTPYAELERISILRQEEGKTRSFNFNYKDVAKGKKVEQNIQLQSGDTIVVPELYTRASGRRVVTLVAEALSGQIEDGQIANEGRSDG